MNNDHRKIFGYQSPNQIAAYCNWKFMVGNETCNLEAEYETRFHIDFSV
jgi:hypothetical protein